MYNWRPLYEKVCIVHSINNDKRGCGDGVKKMTQPPKVFPNGGIRQSHGDVLPVPQDAFEYRMEGHGPRAHADSKIADLRDSKHGLWC